jgi:hypothetical protein
MEHGLGLLADTPGQGGPRALSERRSGSRTQRRALHPAYRGARGQSTTGGRGKGFSWSAIPMTSIPGQ